MYFSRRALRARHVCPGVYKSTLSYFKTHPNLQASSAPRHLTLNLDSVFLLYVNPKVVVLKNINAARESLLKGSHLFLLFFFFTFILSVLFLKKY